jgi:adenylyltransferase/sulfurtransferase
MPGGQGRVVSIREVGIKGQGGGSGNGALMGGMLGAAGGGLLGAILAAAPRAAPAPTLGAPLAGSLLVFDGAEARVRVVRLRARRADCAVCGAAPSITSLAQSEDWAAAAFLAASDDPAATAAAEAARRCADTELCTPSASQAPPVPEVPPSELARVLAMLREPGAAAAPRAPLVLDVRPAHQRAICMLPGSVGAPLAALRREVAAWRERRGQGDVAQASGCEGEEVGDRVILCVCRRGRDSAAAAALLRECGLTGAVSVEGGLERYQAEVDGSFPLY